jgi:hypothetical protein
MGPLHLTRSFGMVLLGIWRILTGILPLFGISFPNSDTLMAVLVIIAGVLILLGL